MKIFASKKAQGLPITTIIIAVLAILVLVVMFAIFTGRITLFGRSLSACPGRCAGVDLATGELPGGECHPTKERALPGEYAAAGQNLALPRDQIKICNACCISIE